MTAKPEEAKAAPPFKPTKRKDYVEEEKAMTDFLKKEADNIFKAA
jgi:hypothetical protein